MRGGEGDVPLLTPDPPDPPDPARSESPRRIAHTPLWFPALSVLWPGREKPLARKEARMRG
ncbi:hypothetical protein GCM10012275_35670 [Longimycelium tulufanense]|uniref:Uncharacterized protein n=1 Tax=Longimycelium tulufanense TaxID=907463 RepID=A0A8J3FV92_9PSEU|nr:hypothetical protein GCM10012275_35670 [Longimycelium tulufanense]